MAEPVLRLANIQGDVVPGFHRSHQLFLFLAVADAAAAKRWLAAQAEQVTSAEEVMGLRRPDRDGRRRGEVRLRSDAVWRNVALGRGGLGLLGLHPDRVADEAFRGGMAARSVDLGDPREPARPGHASRWEVGGPANPADVLLILASDDADALSAAGDAAEAALAGLRLVHRQDGHLLPGEVEHFGFVDGISQPAPRGRASEAPDDFLVSRTLPPGDPDARRLAKPGQPLLPPGQFVFGYEWLKDEAPRSGLDGEAPAGTGGAADWSSDGSLMVVRQLRQDVPAFRRFLAAEAERLSAAPGLAALDAERLGALLVGRWKGGGPLVRFPDGEGTPANRFEVNHFGFAEAARPMVAREDGARTEVAGAPADAEGLRCPMSAHIRKVNPRDATTDRGGGPETLLTMVLRRGIPYGPLLPEVAASPGADPANGRRGLMFVCYQASIVDQFEVLNSRWMNREFVPEGGAGHDLIVGQNNRPGQNNERRCPLRSASSDEAATVKAVADWVVPTGGGYFFVPSLATLRLAGGAGTEGDAAGR